MNGTPPIVLILAVSTIRSNLPVCSTVNPDDSSAPRNSRYASSGVISSGATTVTFLLLAGMVPGSRNCLHVIDEIHAMRSPSSVSGFRFSFTIRLPAGNFLQVLKSFSPISWSTPVDRSGDQRPAPCRGVPPRASSRSGRAAATLATGHPGHARKQGRARRAGRRRRAGRSGRLRCTAAPSVRPDSRGPVCRRVLSPPPRAGGSRPGGLQPPSRHALLFRLVHRML